MHQSKLYKDTGGEELATYIKYLTGLNNRNLLQAKIFRNLTNTFMNKLLAVSDASYYSALFDQYV